MTSYLSEIGLQIASVLMINYVRVVWDTSTSNV